MPVTGITMLIFATNLISEYKFNGTRYMVFLSELICILIITI